MLLQKDDILPHKHPSLHTARSPVHARMAHGYCPVSTRLSFCLRSLLRIGALYGGAVAVLDPTTNITQGLFVLRSYYKHFSSRNKTLLSAFQFSRTGASFLPSICCGCQPKICTPYLSVKPEEHNCCREAGDPSDPLNSGSYNRLQVLRLNEQYSLLTSRLVVLSI